MSNRSKLGEVCDILCGFPFESSRFLTDGHGPLLVRGMNVKRGNLDWSGSEAKRWPTKDPSLDEYELASGDIVIAMDGLVGRSNARLTDKDLPAYLVQRVARLRAKPAANQSYLYHLVCSASFARHCWSRKTGTTISHISKADIEDFEIPRFGQRSERRLGHMLDLAESAQRVTDAFIAAKREQKRGLMQQLLTGKVRFPGFTEPWKTVRLGEVLAESRIPGSTGAVARKITIKLYGKGVHAKIEKRPGSENTRYFRRCTGQLIYSKLDCLNGAFGIVPAELDGFESTLDMPAFDVHSNANSDWLLAVVGRPSFYSRFKDGADGSRKAQRVDPTRFLAEQVELPTRDEQDRIAATHAAMTREINLLVEQRSALASQRRGLMERLLSGDIVLPSSDTSAA